MYLVSVYFDEKTDGRIRQLIKQVASKTGNYYMQEGNVPPHITVSAFESKQEQEIISRLDEKIRDLKCGELQWVSAGQFLPGVIFLSVVLNEYLHKLSEDIYSGIKGVEDLSVSRYYQPFQWFPHTTIAKKLTREEMTEAFQILQNQFGMFSGHIVKIGLAKTNPYRDIAVWDLV